MWRPLLADGEPGADARRVGWRARLKRRTLLRSAGGAGALGLGLGGYAFGYEPGVRLRVVEHPWRRPIGPSTCR